MVGYFVKMQNACGSSINVIVPKYAWRPLGVIVNNEDFIDVVKLPCRDQRGLFSPLSAAKKDLQTCLPEDYILNTSSEGASIQIDKEKLLLLLDKAELKKSGDIYTWTIVDSAVCPKSDNQ
jgi:hypothetical protein